MKVLMVDDCADTSQLLEEIFVMHGHQVCTAQDGVEALRVAEVQEFDAAVLDIGMPGLDGFEVAIRLRELYPSVMRIALTGWAPQSVGEEMVARFDHYLLKPINVDELIGLLGSVDRADGPAVRPL